MKKPDPCVVTILGGWRPPGVCGFSGGGPKRRRNRPPGALEPPCSSEASERLVCTPTTAGFAASTMSAKPAGPELLRPNSSAAEPIPVGRYELSAEDSCRRRQGDDANERADARRRCARCRRGGIVVHTSSLFQRRCRRLGG